jgi:hypothetical protein
MRRIALVAAALFTGVVTSFHATAAAAAPTGPAGAAAAVTTAEAAPFLADWTLTMQGQNGPATFTVSLRVEKEKVVGDVTSDAVPTRPIDDLSMAQKSLVLSYTFPWDGNPIGAVITLTPGDEGKMAAQISFADGAYVMTGTATKKEQPKR